jgi:hypothetical protein
MKNFLSASSITMLVMLLLMTGGCSDVNPEAPSPGFVHPDGWVLSHAGEARTQLADCRICHGIDFAGSVAAVSCFSCHLAGPPFTLHPADWVDTVAGHQDFARTISWTACATAACHGPTLEGGIAGPSCFNVVCHGPGGNPPAAHALPFTDPAAHGPTARTSQFFCRNCHGRPTNDFNGGFVADLFTDPVTIEINPTGNCSLCHPAAKAHPTSWQGTNDPNPAYPASHRGIDVTTQAASCALCHLTTGPGSGPVPAAPSCFSANHTNADHSTTICHADGPRTAPHPIDGSYRAPAAHGRAAKQDLTFCQKCHALPRSSGPGSNPRFNVVLGTLTAGCETCHLPFYAHPETWAGPNAANVFHYQAGNIDNACTLCHGANLDGIGGVGANGVSPGRRCRQCHADTTLFNLNCSACHEYPPDGVTAEPRVAILGGVLVNHNNLLGAAVNVATVPLHDQCAVCHGVKSSNTGISGHLSPNANYRTFDVLTGVPGDHWNGQINLNGPTPTTGAGYNATNFGCDNAGCHGNNAAHRLSNSALPVQFGDYGEGDGVIAPHALDSTFRLPANHGPVARTDLTNCKTCHGQATTTNPRYNVGIGGSGCETCHNDNTAHPSFRAGSREITHWYDVQWRHSNGTKSTFATACSMCHPGIGGTGSVGPACTSCHRANPVINNNGCVSCHSLPPNGANGIAGNLRPNRTGNHSRGAHSSGISNTPLNTCGVCHGTDFGPGNASHFDQTPGANVLMTGVGAGIAISQTGGKTTCTGTCHSQNHNFTW